MNDHPHRPRPLINPYVPEFRPWQFLAETLEFLARLALFGALYPMWVSQFFTHGLITLGGLGLVGLNGYLWVLHEGDLSKTTPWSGPAHLLLGLALAIGAVRQHLAALFSRQPSPRYAARLALSTGGVLLLLHLAQAAQQLRPAQLQALWLALGIWLFTWFLLVLAAYLAPPSTRGPSQLADWPYHLTHLLRRSTRRPSGLMVARWMFLRQPGPLERKRILKALLGQLPVDPALSVQRVALYAQGLSGEEIILAIEQAAASVYELAMPELTEKLLMEQIARLRNERRLVQ